MFRATGGWNTRQSAKLDGPISVDMGRTLGRGLPDATGSAVRRVVGLQQSLSDLFTIGNLDLVKHHRLKNHRFLLEALAETKDL